MSVLPPIEYAVLQHALDAHPNGVSRVDHERGSKERSCIVGRGLPLRTEVLAPPVPGGCRRCFGSRIADAGRWPPARGEWS